MYTAPGLAGACAPSALCPSQHTVPSSPPCGPPPPPPPSFSQACKLLRLEDAWRCALALKSADVWRQLGVAALEALDVDTAVAAYRQVGQHELLLGG